MLGLFSSKPDHPLADAKEAKRFFESLPGREPGAAIHEATALLESLPRVEGFKPEHRLALAVQLDEAAIVSARRLGRDYVSARLTRVTERRLFEESREYWSALIDVYEDNLRRFEANEKGSDAIKASLPLLYARLLHAATQSLKWAQFRYGPTDGEIWQLMGRSYLGAVARNLADKPVTLYPGMPEPTTVTREYLRALVFQASSMDKLLPLEIELAEYLIAHFLPRFVFTAEVRPDNVYWVDAAKAAPPARLAKRPEVAPTLRFFNSVPALEAVEELKRRIAGAGRVPNEIMLGGSYAPEAVLPVLEHLAMCWSPKPPMRGHARHRVKSRLYVANGLASMHRQLSGSGDCAECESWVVDDVSQGGMGAKVTLNGGDWIRIGAMIAMQPDGVGNWLIGVVRRFARESETLGAVGIQTISKTPRAIVADAGGLRTEGILLEMPQKGESVRMILPPQSWEEGVGLLFPLDGVRVRLYPEAVIDKGPDIIVARYLVQEYG